VFENGVLRGIFGTKRDGVTEDWRTLHNEELHNLYFLLSIIRVMNRMRIKSAGNVACMWRKSNSQKVLVAKPEGCTPLRIFRHM
jgi:hypothetical protein